MTGATSRALAASMTALVALAVPPGAARAASPVGTPVLRIERIDVSAPPRIRLFVTQVGQDGQVGRPPSPGAVKLVVDGQPLEAPELRIGTAKSVGEPLAVTFVLQDSGGMEAAFAEAQRSLLEIGDALPAGSQVGLVSFANTVRTAIDPKPFSQVKDELSRLALDTEAIETQLGLGVLRGLEGLIGAKAVSLPSRRVLLVVAEGLTSSYERTEFTGLASKAKDNGVRIHAVGYYKFGEPEQPTLALLSSLSKGTLRAYADPAGVREGLKAAGAELSDQWVIDLDQPRLFDGIRHDFQLELEGGQASEVERAIVPASTAGKTQDLGPALYGAAAVLVLVALIAVVLVIGRRRKAEAQKVMENLQPVVMEKTSMTDARDVRAALAASRNEMPALNGAEDTAPPAADRPLPMPMMDTGPVAVVSAPPPPRKPIDDRPPIASNSGGDDMLELPSPTQFLRRIDRGVEEAASLAPPVLGLDALKPLPLQDFTGPHAPAVKPVEMSSEANDITDLEIRVPGTRQELPAQRDLDPVPLAPSPGLQSAQNARLESGAMMLKTQVLAPSAGTRSDAVAWLARLGAHPTTTPLVSGHKVGSATFSIDTLGRWVLRIGDAMKLLSDGEVIELDGEVYLMKLATRLRPTPSIKDGVLLIVGGPDDGRVVSMTRGEPRIVGAHPRADVRVRGKQVAPQHLGLSLESGKLHVADLGTTEGFKLDGEQVWKASLVPGQEVQLGTVRLVFQRG